METHKILVWLVVGAIAGTVAGSLVTLSRRGFGTLLNVVVGMLGAFVGGFIFRGLGIQLGLGEVRIAFDDLVAALAGSLLCIVAWRLIRRASRSKNPADK